MDVLFNNAAYSLSKTLWDTTEEEWDKVMRVNLKGYFLCAKYALPLLKKSGHGAIICTGSELGIVGCVESLAYNSKGGVIQFAKSLALELAPFGIRVNVVCPSGTETPAFVKDMSRSGNYEGEVKRLVASYPLKRLASPSTLRMPWRSSPAKRRPSSPVRIDGGRRFHRAVIASASIDKGGILMGKNTETAKPQAS